MGQVIGQLGVLRPQSLREEKRTVESYSYIFMSGVENWFLIDVTLLKKKVATLSAVREIMEGL